MEAFFQSLHKTLVTGLVRRIIINILVGLIGRQFIWLDAAALLRPWVGVHWVFDLRWSWLSTSGL